MGWEFDDADVQVGLPAEGEHLAYLRKATLKNSQRGEEMAELEFQSNGGGLLCYDTVMLEGRGLGIGLKKLQQLGVALKDEDRGKWVVDDIETWEGRQVYLTIRHEEFNGKTRAKVDFEVEGFGYRMVGADVEPPDKASTYADDEDIPF